MSYQPPSSEHSDDVPLQPLNAMERASTGRESVVQMRVHFESELGSDGEFVDDLDDADPLLLAPHGHGPSIAAVRKRSATMHEHSHVHHMTPAERQLMYSYEALDYDVAQNALYRREYMLANKASVRRETIARWIVYALIGVITGTLAFILAYFVEKLSEWKFDLVTDGVQDGEYRGPFAAFFFVSVGFCLTATALVSLIEPVAAGSGIPEIKAYLNGTNQDRFVRIKTLIVKAVGVVFSVSGGLTIGKEGPLVHSGACIAANLSNATWCNNWSVWPPHWRRWIQRFRNDKDKRDFVAGGAAAGVAAAFGAPIGGILFSLEEASSFWSTQLTWMAFLAAMLATFMLNALKIARSGDSTFTGLISFGPPIRGQPYRIWETPFFMVLAVFGGLAGAAFNHFNERLCHWRRSHLSGKSKRYWRMVEACAIGGITATFAFWAPYWFDNCAEIPTKDRGDHNEHGGEIFYSPYRCKDGQYNTMASIMFTTSEVSIRGFFHNSGKYEESALIAYFFIVFFLAVITYGIAVPSGLFVPCILMGCAFGRLSGELMREWFPDEDIIPGTYAVVGATAMLGGVSRMTISLTVIIVETTQDVEFALPIMLALLISKWVGDLFNISLYDLHVELRCIPFVESKPSSNMYHLTAGEIMQSPVTIMQETMKVGDVLDILGDCTHNGFPVVSDADPHHLVGMILRNHLIVLINKRAFGPKEDALSVVQYEDFATSLSSKRVQLQPFDELDRDLTLDLSGFMNPVPVSVQPECPLSRVFVLFRSLGIRHLPVVDHRNVVVGIITRKEVMSSFDQDLY